MTLPKRKQRKPPHQPTDALRQTVQMHAMVGTRQEIIADVLRIDEKTLRKYYRDELDLSKAKANATIGGALFNKAKGGDVSAMIFWMKTQAGFKESTSIEHTGPNGGPIQTINSEMTPQEAAAAYADTLNSNKG